MTEHEGSDTKVPICFRDPKTIASLPINLIWELTRRHGNYVAMWQLARSDTAGVSPDFRKRAVLWLQMIGVTGDPVDPALRFEDIDGDSLPLVSYQGALWPLTFRSLVELLVTKLPSSTRSIIANLLYVDPQPASAADELLEVKRIIDSKDLNFLDVDVPGGHVSVNPYVATTVVTDEAREIVNDLKAQRETTSSRRRNDDILGYLRVWDFREGWIDGHYDATAELTFQEIARVEKAPISTLVDRYQAAFQLITGHNYSNDGWVKLFGGPKIRACFRRGERPRVSLSRIKTVQGDGEPVAAEPDSPPLDVSGEDDLKNLPPDSDVDQLIADISAMIRLGKSNEVICSELELNGAQLIEYFRKRQLDCL